MVAAKTPPGEDPTLLTIILEAALFTAATMFHGQQLYVCYKAQDSLTDDIKTNRLTVLKNKQGNNGNPQAQHPSRHLFTPES